MEKNKQVGSDKFYDLKPVQGIEWDFLLETAIANLIGKTIIYTNSLESAMDFLITNILDDDTGWMAIQDKSYAQKVNYLLNLVKIQNIEFMHYKTKEKMTRDELESLGEDLRTTGVIRNKIVHSDWDDMSTDFYFRNKSKMDKKGEIKHTLVKFNLEELINQVESIDLLSTQMWSLRITK